MRSLFACATPRTAIAAAKLLLLSGWGLLTAVALGPALIAVGVASGHGLPDPHSMLVIARLVVMTALTSLLALVAGLFASLSRGYLGAVGGLIGLVAGAQIAVVSPAAQWCPWSLPGLWALSADTPGLPEISTWRLALVPLAALPLAVATVHWWRRSELV